MIAKMILPLAGGTAAVWSTCMVFFQAALLGGYWYAHAGPKRFGPRQFARPHSLLIFLPIIALAIAAWFGSPLSPIEALAPRGEDYPFFNLVVLLAALVGLPFFFLATSAPLLQRWFAETDSPHAGDPYFLYAASNLGSLLGLIAYPAVIERYMRLSQQAWLFAIGFGIWAVLIWCCAAAISRAQLTDKKKVERPAPPIPRSEKLHWLILAAVPSSLMLSVTSHATVDLAPIPLFIVVPLGLYLLTFVIAFGRPGEWLGQLMSVVAPVALLLLIFMRVAENTQPKNLVIALSIQTGVFFLTALACHLELARRRPQASQLTEYFLWVSLGGVLGGLFNALLAPVIFKEHTEYTVGLIAACFIVTRSRHTGPKPSISVLLDIAVPMILGCVVFMLVRFWPDLTEPVTKMMWNAEKNMTLGEWIESGGMFLRLDQLKSILCYGIPILVSFAFVDRPVRFGLCVAAICLASYMNISSTGTILRSRSFFGVLQVTQVPPEPTAMESVYHKLVHGTTLHGMQQVEPLSDDPLTYYHHSGPVGDIFSSTPAGKSKGPVAFIGLGTGSLTAYAKPGQKVTIYEIDPAVRRIATNPKYFTYYKDAEKRGGEISMIMGDVAVTIGGSRTWIVCADRGRCI